MEDREIRGLEEALERIWEVARGFGLDPYPVRFEVVPAAVMYEIGSGLEIGVGFEMLGDGI